MGQSLTEEIDEGADIYFECDVDANPSKLKLSWLKDVSVVSLNISLNSFQCLNIYLGCI